LDISDGLLLTIFAAGKCKFGDFLLPENILTDKDVKANYRDEIPSARSLVILLHVRMRYIIV